jgi:hypothetical protein
MLAERDEQLFRDGLTEPQQAVFDDWQLYVEKWVEKRYALEDGHHKIRDFQGAMCEALLALRRAAASHNGRGTFRPFLDRILKNAMADMRRREEYQGQPVSIDALPCHVDSEDGHSVGLDAEDLNVLDQDKLPCPECVDLPKNDRIVRQRSRKPRKRFRGGDSEVLRAVMRAEMVKLRLAYRRAFRISWKWAMRGTLLALGWKDDEISAAIVAEEKRLKKDKKNAAQRKWRAKERQLAMT